MLSKGFKIVSPKTFEIYYEDIKIKENHALVKVEMGAICKADLRYYMGKRDKKVLGLKYPMRLIHEATGVVIKDPTGTFEVGQRVVLVPNIFSSKLNHSKRTFLEDSSLGENYDPFAKFASSNVDGFSCEYLSFPVRNIIPFKESTPIHKAVFSELTSVGISAMRRCGDLNNKVIGVWGDGILGYILSSILVNNTNSRIISIGKNGEKLEQFKSHKTYYIKDHNIKKENIDIAFECVGGNSSKFAINEIIDVINIGGQIVLTGVAENNIEINTRKILEKGLTLTGSTRSSVEDFKKSISLIEETSYGDALDTLIKDIRMVENITDYYEVFEIEAENRTLGKTIMKFKL